MTEELFYKSAGVTKETSFSETVKGCFDVVDLPKTPDPLNNHKQLPAPLKSRLKAELNKENRVKS